MSSAAMFKLQRFRADTLKCLQILTEIYHRQRIDKSTFDEWQEKIAKILIRISKNEDLIIVVYDLIHSMRPSSIEKEIETLSVAVNFLIQNVKNFRQVCCAPKNGPRTTRPTTKEVLY